MKNNVIQKWLLIISVFILIAVYFYTGDKQYNIEINGTNRYSLKDPYITFDITQHLKLEEADESYDIYNNRGSYGYRYGPSIIYYDDGSMDCYFSSPGNYSEWDYIRYRHFDGEDWNIEEIILKPTKGSEDKYSVCDPGVIYFNGYYYLGYTSTNVANNGGVFNHVFVARSTNPNGPFEKWNGEGWGGSPKPIIEYTGNETDWGAGEVSFVIYEDKLYCYYSWIGSTSNDTRLSIADLSEDWPNSLEYVGVAMDKNNGKDSFDVAYIDEYKKFIAVSVEYRLSEDSSIVVYESDDGITFERSYNYRNVLPYAHNCGISKDPQGHIDINKDLIIGYAYGSYNSWGKWSTRFQPINIKTYLKK